MFDTDDIPSPESNLRFTSSIFSIILSRLPIFGNHVTWFG